MHWQLGLQRCQRRTCKFLSALLFHAGASLPVNCTAEVWTLHSCLLIHSFLCSLISSFNGAIVLMICRPLFSNFTCQCTLNILDRISALLTFTFHIILGTNMSYFGNVAPDYFCRRTINKGIGVDNMHYLNDGLWKVLVFLCIFLITFILWLQISISCIKLTI